MMALVHYLVNKVN